jgi:hypothetical protein
MFRYITNQTVEVEEGNTCTYYCNDTMPVCEELPTPRNE